MEATQTANPPSFETVWAILQEVGKKQEELAKSQKETARQMQETDRRLDKQLGKLGNRIGEIVETGYSLDAGKY
jgi:predicted transcriptional regulator